MLMCCVCYSAGALRSAPFPTVSGRVSESFLAIPGIICGNSTSIDIFLDLKNQIRIRNGFVRVVGRSGVLKDLLQKSVIALAVLFVSSSAFAQTAPQELVRQVKHAFVIVTTYDEHAQPLQQGSGFLIASDRIVTNFRLMDLATEIRIKTFNGDTALVEKVVSTNPSADLAILKINAPCRDTTSLQVADILVDESKGVLEFSNPSGSGWKVTASKVVGGTWNLEHVDSRMKVTAGLTSGNSGGPVVNVHGYVIGPAVIDKGSYDTQDPR
jgi:S1-C subfamily serine protease